MKKVEHSVRSWVFVDDPYPSYAELRDRSPVSHFDIGYLITRYEDVKQVVADTERFSSEIPRTSPVGQWGGDVEPGVAEILTRGFPEVDTTRLRPPANAPFRRAAARAFLPRRMTDLEPLVRQAAASLIDSFAPDGVADLVEQFTVPLPLMVIADLLGLPHSDLPLLRRWADDAVAPLAGELTRDRQLECAHSRVESQHYMAEQLEHRRKNPKDDVLSLLARAPEGFSLPELISLSLVLMTAGNETTRNLISNASLALLKHRDQMALVIGNRALIPTMVEEVLRYDSPVQMLFRIALTDVEVAGFPIPEGSRCWPVFASANRDPAVFESPDTFDAAREDATKHLSFGFGMRYCLGAALGRMEAKVAFEELFSRLEGIELDGDDPVRRHPSRTLRGLDRLRIRFQRA